jgi:hypothetical protein
MKQFLVAATKIGVGIALAVVLSGFVAWGVVSIRTGRQTAANASLSKTKHWPSVEGVGTLAPAKFQLLTIWRGGRIYYQFDVDSVPQIVRRAKESGAGTFNIAFLDGDGFKILEKRINLSEMANLVDHDGNFLALTGRATTIWTRRSIGVSRSGNLDGPASHQWKSHIPKNCHLRFNQTMGPDR